MKTRLVYRNVKDVDQDATTRLMNGRANDSMFSRKQIAKRMGFHPSYISDLLNGKRDWSENLAEKFWRATEKAT